MSSIATALRTFPAALTAGSAEDALERATRYLAKVPGFALTGHVRCRSERHQQWEVEVADHGGDVNDCWVILTSYGITPGEALGSSWQTVPGVGA